MGKCFVFFIFCNINVKREKIKASEGEKLFEKKLKKKLYFSAVLNNGVIKLFVCRYKSNC